MGRYQRNHHDRDMHARNTKSPQIIDSFRGKLKPGIGMISESDQPSKSDHKGKSRSPRGRSRSLHLMRRWQSAYDIHSAAKSSKTPIRKESHTLSDSFRGKLEPDIGMISESDQLSQSDHKKKTPSTPATSLHVDRRWQSAALDISSAVDCPKTPMREESERGKSPRFEWVKKKIPFVKKR
jgi:hypothetical protein